MASDFENRLQRAVERGAHRGAARKEEAAQQQLSLDELKTLHGKYRLTLSDHIEKCVSKLPQHFPGFRVETTFGDRGWGAACSRDDFQGRKSSGRQNLFSRLELSVPPFSEYAVLELAGKGTIQNREVFRRSYFKPLAEVDLTAFLELVDAWVVEYAELFAASSP